MNVEAWWTRPFSAISAIDTTRTLEFPFISLIVRPYEISLHQRQYQTHCRAGTRDLTITIQSGKMELFDHESYKCAKNKIPQKYDLNCWVQINSYVQKTS